MLNRIRYIEIDITKICKLLRIASVILLKETDQYAELNQ